MEWMNLKRYVFLVALVAYFTCEARPQQKLKIESKFIPENRHEIENFRRNISTAVTTVKSDDVTTDLENEVRHRKQSEQDFEWIGRKSRKETSILPYVVVQHSLTLRNFTLVKVPMLGFMTAQKHCEKNGGHLATVEAQQDVDTMRKLLALSSYENDRYIFEAYVGDGGRQTDIYAMAVAVREFLLAATIAAAVQYHPVSGMEILTKTRPNNIRAASIPSPVSVETQPPLLESNDRSHPDDTRPLLSPGVSQNESKFIEQRLYVPDFPRDSTGNKVPFVTHPRTQPRTTTRKPMPIRNFEEVKSRYKLFEGLGYYRVIKSPRLRWSDARVACAEDDAHLAVINSPEEARALVMTYHELGVKGDIVVQQAYVGVSDSMKEGDYVTIFGTPLNATGFSSWAPGELSKEAHILEGKDCLTLHTSGYLKVVNCRARLPYFCEHELDGKNNNIVT